MSLEYALVSFTIEKLGEVLVKEAELLSEVEGQVQSLQRELTWMQSYLKDVDEVQEEGNETLHLRIREIRKISFDAEDVIDSFILAVGTKRKESLLRRYACCFNSLVHAHQLATEIKAIKTRIRENTEMLERYQVGGTTESIRSRRPRSYPHGDDNYVVGLEDDIDKLVEQLTQKNNLAYILCIVGMGGSGKTTLARKLYNHQIIKRYFQCQAWVSISQEWNAQQILVEILRQATGQRKKADEIGSIEELVDELREYLKQTPYLIVLDDVWKKESMEDLLPAFPIKSKGSRIIVTTRIHKVVQFPGMSCMLHEPRRLTEGESWDLFSKIAWNQRQSIDNDLCNGNFEKLGKEMLKKCDGLPLAIIALGGLLGEMDTIEEWERVSKAVSAKVMGSRGTHMYGSVKDMIALSYKELPYNLKPYFLYLSLFPEGFEIPVGMLTRMWIAEGFITPQQLCVGETLEDAARQILDELIRRCIVQIVSKNYEGKAKEVRIHDLMRDFGVKKAKELDFLEILTSESSGTSSTIEDGIIVQSRRIGNHSCSSVCAQFGTQDSHVRSLIMMDKSSFSRKKARISSLEHVYKNFRLLRVLCIWGVSTFDGALPTEMGDLIHLRYLGLRWTNIRVFPKSIGQLRNLLTFECSHLARYHNTEIRIPNVLWKMDQLRHLLLPLCAATEEEYTFHTLKNLQSLRGVVGGDWMLKEMPTLSPTVKRLCIDVSSMEQLDAVFQCPSVVSDHLRSLNLEWHKEKLYLEQQKLEVLCRCHHLRKLKLRGAIVDGMSSPVWFPSNLVKLVLCHAYLKSPETMAALGKLPSLRCLKLLDEAYIGTEWVCRAGEFPQLEFLKVVNLSRLEDWRVEARAMPRLSLLKLQKCDVLERLPEELRNIASLEELMIACMPKTFLRRLRRDAGNGGETADRGGGEDIHIIQHISRVTIL